MEVNEIGCDVDLAERKAKVEAALVRLKSIRSRVVELRTQCEAFKKMEAERQTKTKACSECGKDIEQGQEVMVKVPSGKPRRCYHRNCFKAIWISQSWRLDYSSPGFLRISESSR